MVSCWKMSMFMHGVLLLKIVKGYLNKNNTIFLNTYFLKLLVKT